MVHSTTAQLSPSEVADRPKGILKNSNSFRGTSPDLRISPSREAAAPPRPELPRGLSEQALTQMNTNMNAGGGQRRNSSNPRGSSSRRQSSSSGLGQNGEPDTSPRLKWDEANLYLNEGQMGGRMKIDEPKTPYAGHYDPSEDDMEDTSAINPEQLVVDELDQAQADKGEQTTTQRRRAREEDIPSLDLGEPEVDMGDAEHVPSESERRVIVDADQMDVDGAHHGEDLEAMTIEEREKHQKFERLRKKHYEMKNVKDLLGHAEEADEE